MDTVIAYFLFFFSQILYVSVSKNIAKDTVHWHQPLVGGYQSFLFPFILIPSISIIQAPSLYLCLLVVLSLTFLVSKFHFLHLKILAIRSVFPMKFKSERSHFEIIPKLIKICMLYFVFGFTLTHMHTLKNNSFTVNHQHRRSHSC